MKNKTILVRETYMSDGVDLIHSWSSVDEALESGRFEYLNEMWDQDISWEEVCQIENLKEFIEKVGYPFELES
jgi:ribosome-associated toxin RatA of RatAB toxin-antitoxin module